MNKLFEITDDKVTTELLDTAEYGVLALGGEKPYAVPVNFVYLNGSICFHGSPRGRKMSLLEKNNHVSFSVVADEVIIPSFFSSTKGSACPASAFFKSVIIDGETEIITNREELTSVFTAMMEKLQPEGRYEPFESSMYDNPLTAVCTVKIKIKHMSVKFKFGQNLSPERFQMVVDHLEKRGREVDVETVKTMKQLYPGSTGDTH